MITSTVASSRTHHHVIDQDLFTFHGIRKAENVDLECMALSFLSLTRLYAYLDETKMLGRMRRKDTQKRRAEKTNARGPW
jgi:hypothetical protein